MKEKSVTALFSIGHYANFLALHLTVSYQKGTMEEDVRPRARARVCVFQTTNSLSYIFGYENSFGVFDICASKGEMSLLGCLLSQGH